MYEPVWYPQKTQATWAEAMATLAATATIVVLHLERRKSRPRQPYASLAPAASN
jgi:hypothetical protein